MNVTIIRPGGNDTALVEGIPELKDKIKINNYLMKRYPFIEQVGFYQKINNNDAQLEMAGGEFCGNALRSLAYLLLFGKVGEQYIKVSGIKQTLTAGIKSQNTAFAEMPIIQSFKSVQKIRKDLFRVRLSGITHLITPDLFLDGNELKIRGLRLLKDSGLLYKVPAAGVMFVSKDKNSLSIRPIVWVRNLQTLFYETACASGTTAVGLWDSLLNNQLTTSIKVKQPSGDYISVLIERTNTGFIKAEIDGPIKILKKIYEEK